MARHWFVKNVIELLPDLVKSGLVTTSEVKKGIDESAPADKQPPTIITFTTKDGCYFEIVASRNARKVLVFDAGKKQWPSGQFKIYRRLVSVVIAAGIHMFEPQRIA